MQRHALYVRVLVISTSSARIVAVVCCKCQRACGDVRITTLLENFDLRHKSFYGSRRRPKTKQHFVKSSRNSPWRTRTAEPRCGWWLLTWLGSSRVFSMTEPAWSARSNSSRSSVQVTLVLLFECKYAVGLKPDGFTGCWRGMVITASRKCATKELFLRHPINKERYRSVSKLSLNSWPAVSLWGNTRYPQSNALRGRCSSSPPGASNALLF